MEINETVALVTGAASGLGRATALALANRGATVVGVDLAATSDVVHNERILPHDGDVTVEDDVVAALDLAAMQGTLRTVVQCAGIVTGGRVVGRQAPGPLDDFARCVHVNLVGTYNVLRLAAHRMAQADVVGEERGVIVTTASIAAFDGQIGQAAYSASKAGVVGMTLPVARELAAHQIRCVSIAPGMFDTPMLTQLPNPVRQALAAQVPHPSRFGTSDEYAQLVVDVIGNPMLNGTTIRLDGALRMPPT